jgi:hypothetical protein
VRSFRSARVEHRHVIAGIRAGGLDGDIRAVRRVIIPAV